MIEPTTKVITVERVEFNSCEALDQWMIWEQNKETKEYHVRCWRRHNACDLWYKEGGYYWFNFKRSPVIRSRVFVQTQTPHDREIADRKEFAQSLRRKPYTGWQQ